MRRTVVLLSIVIFTSCKGGNSSPSSPSPPPAPSAATITITAAGVDPRTVQVTQGSRVTFVNNDTQPHDMASDPHPDHTQCPDINSVGDLTPGQSRQTGNLNVARTCGYHDHRLGQGTRFDGTIVVTPR